MSGGEVLLRIAGDADKYRKELEKIPGFTATQAKKASDAWARSQAIAAAQVTAGIRKSGEDAAKAWGEVGKKLGTLAGGPFATIADVVTELVPKAGAASSAIGGIAVAGGALAGTAVAIAAVAAAAFKLAGAAGEARDRLHDAGRAAEIPPSARDGVLAYDRATRDLSQSVDLLVATLGGELGGALASVVRATAGAVEGLAKLYGGVYRAESGVEALGNALQITGRIATGVATLGVTELVRHFTGLGTEAEKAAEKVERSLTKIGTDAAIAEAEIEEAARRDAGKRADRILEERKREAERQAEDAKRRAIAAAREQASLEEQIRRATERDTEAHYATIAGMREGLSESMRAFAEADAAAVDAANRVTVERTLAGFDAILDGLERLEAEIAATEERRQSLYDRTNAAIVESFGQFGQVAAEASDLAVWAAENMAKGQKKAAREAAEYAKRLAIVSAILSGIEAVAKAAASAPPPFNVPSIIAATATAGMQVAKATATKIPSFFAGGRDRGDGEGLATLHKGESVLNARATDAIVRALNTGLSPLSGMAMAGGPADVYLDGRQVGRAIARAQRRTAALGPPPGYSRRRGR